MISAQAIYKRMMDLMSEFGEGSQVVQTAKQFIRENVDGQFIDDRGIIRQRSDIGEMPKLDKRADLVDAFIPTVTKAYTQASKEIAADMQETENKKAKEEGRKPNKIKTESAKKIKAMSDPEKAPYRARINRRAEDIADYEKLKWDVYKASKDNEYPRQEEAVEIFNEATPTSEWCSRARELVADYEGALADRANEARGKVVSDGYTEVNPGYDDYADF